MAYLETKPECFYWTLPGVVTGGRAQVLLKSHHVRPGIPGVNGGVGAPHLVGASHMHDAGMVVVALEEYASTLGPGVFYKLYLILSIRLIR